MELSSPELKKFVIFFQETNFSFILGWNFSATGLKSKKSPFRKNFLYFSKNKFSGDFTMTADQAIK